MKEISEEVDKRKIFEKVIYFETKKYRNKRTKIDKYKEVFDIIFRNNNRYGKYIGQEKNFDEIMYYNADTDIYGLYSIIAHVNPKVVVSRFEEGILSYENQNNDDRKWKLIRAGRKICFKKNFQDTNGFFYCYYPTIYKGQLIPFQVPLINKDDKKLINELKTIFSIDSISSIQYERHRYIYLQTSYESDGISIGETELILRLCQRLGIDNLLVKSHPRVDPTDLIKRGIHVDTNSSIPFEVLQLTIDFSKNVFLTPISGSVLSINAIVDKPIDTYLLYKILGLENNPLTKDYLTQAMGKIDYLKRNGKIPNTKIIQNIDEIE